MGPLVAEYSPNRVPRPLRQAKTRLCYSACAWLSASASDQWICFQSGEPVASASRLTPAGQGAGDQRVACSFGPFAGQRF